ncbi:DUF4468 domain-containing protein [Spirosoma aerolatum]|uniref:DUF4468 domain-containing protein n=1 Tax=Spirosoma aerolatum TaxID=1211326 RepID=UPI0009ACBE91|nr:DUF4468 domain-containing protein [Spirosoma aerolatum]
MKAVFLVLMVSLNVIAQSKPANSTKLGEVLPLDATGRVQYQVVEQIGNTNKDELFQRARRWFAQTYKSANASLQISDAATGELSGKGTFIVRPTSIGIPQDTDVDYSISVEIKDGRYRATIDNFFVRVKTIQGPIETVKGASKGFMQKVYDQTNDQVYTLLLSLNRALKTPKSDF